MLLLIRVAIIVSCVSILKTEATGSSQEPQRVTFDSFFIKQTDGKLHSLDERNTILSKQIDSLRTCSDDLHKRHHLWNGILSMICSTYTCWITLAGVMIALGGFGYTIMTFNRNNKIRRSEFIDNLFKEFRDEDTLLFLALIDQAMDSGDEFNEIRKLKRNDKVFEHFEIGREKTLAYIDKLYYFWENDLLTLDEWEYFAYEIISLTKSEYIRRHISTYYEKLEKRQEKYGVKDLKVIFPYTGLVFLKGDGDLKKDKRFEDEILNHCRKINRDYPGLLSLLKKYCKQEVKET
jgi:hypothetical protein